ncbi:MAG: error-prone polymerase, partial [Ramlibacter sp.]|nr:error-prone polymerase [Ramlibacter sp.]
QRAHELGYTALAITDECSVAGVVRAHGEAKKLGLKLLLGSEFALDGFRLVVLAKNVQGWGNLCEFITLACREAEKGKYVCSREGSDFALLADCEILLSPERSLTLEELCERVAWAQDQFGSRAWLAAELLLLGDDELWLQTLQQAGEATGIPVVAAGDVHMHARSRKPLQDVMTAVRLGKPVHECCTNAASNCSPMPRGICGIACGWHPRIPPNGSSARWRCRIAAASPWRR